MENIASISTGALFCMGFVFGVATTVAIIATRAYYDAKQELDMANARVRIANRKND